MIKMEEETKAVIESLNELNDDSTVPKSLRGKLQNVIGYLGEEGDLSLRVDRALHELENLSDDNNLQSYTRTQIWNIVSMLETLK